MPASAEPEAIVYTKLKALFLTTHLASEGQALARIVVPAAGRYREQAERIQQAIQTLAGVILPIIADSDPEAGVPIRGNLIVLGNRSTNRAISDLYNRFFTLLDLKYPGAGGYEVRSLHNPFGGGHNVLFVGGSDDRGVDVATERLIELLPSAGARKGALSIGWVMEVRLGDGITAPKELTEFETWEASAGYGSIGYFGWNSISKRMAMYYMTGDAFHAREAIRLAFPDARAFEEITRIDEERIEDKGDPLAGPYHYNAHMMVLFWDLIEESPVFTDEERLRVTNAFSRQFFHKQDWGSRRQIYERSMKGEPLPPPPAQVGSRHGQWSAISLYCLGRYFRKDYPEPFWQGCMDYARWHFSPLHEHAWISGEADNLFWYNTGMAPVLTYMLLTGDRKPQENSVLATLLGGQDILVSGLQPDWALNSGALDYFHKAAYLTGDGRWLLYRQRTGMDVSIFRLGQSFWPDESLRPSQPTDLVNRWSILPLPDPLWKSRKTGLPFEESFFFGSFRSATDASGDFTLIKGFNGASRNPYHTFAVLELRQDGHTLLRGYHNQVQVRVDGLVEPHIAMDAALRFCDMTGRTAVAVAEVPDAPFCNWRRALIQRTGRYVLFVDDLAFRDGGEGTEVEVVFETERPVRALTDGRIAFEAPTETGDGKAAEGRIATADAMATVCRGRIVRMAWRGAVKKDERRRFFSLVGMGVDGCYRVADNAAALSLPGPALTVAGRHRGVEGELAVLAGDHLYGRRVREIGLDGALLKATVPVDADWDFKNGSLHLVAATETQLELSLSEGQALRLDGRPLSRDAAIRMRLAPGRHILEGAIPEAALLKRTGERLAEALAEGQANRARLEGARQAKAGPELQALGTAFQAEVGGKVVDLVAIPSKEGDLLCAAEGQTIHVLRRDGTEVRRLSTDGLIRMLRWWPEHRLLLAGCADEKVIAFGETGERRWTFVSEMHPEVFRAAKQYWFKSAPGHEGVHGLHTGVFLSGKSQAFVGGACTLEILNERGELVNRHPVFWGPGALFGIVDGPEGSLNLLIGRVPNDGTHLAIINNRDLEAVVHGSKSVADGDRRIRAPWDVPTVKRGFNSVPEGATFVASWMSASRNHIFYEDLDGDGVREVASEINGSWNRVTVWTAEGKPLYDASFGPGDFTPARNMRDVDVVDIDGDGKKEILIATSGGLVVALSHRCEKIWAARLDSPATVMKCASADAAPRIFAGCEDGGVIVLDGKGTRMRIGEVKGVPTRIETAGGLMAIGTDLGQVRGFVVER